MKHPTWFPPPDSITAPDQIPEGALRLLVLLEDERIARCWRTHTGYLVMTNLRCIHLWHQPELFVPTEWHEGPSLFFYNLLAPRVQLGRFLELSEGVEEDLHTVRFLVPNPATVAAEIDSARAAGRSEWERRRARVQEILRASRAPASGGGPPLVREVIREVVKVRCRYCGNLMDETQPRCPTCGAPES